MHSYNAFGCRITSDIELPRLSVTGHGTAPLLIQSSVFSTEMERVSERGRLFRGRVPNVGRFFFDSGKRIVVERNPEVTDELFRLTLLGTIVSIALRQKGWLPLHASGVVIGGRAYLFLGDTGAGKSTLAYSICDTGRGRLLTDDVAPIEFVNGMPVVHSAYPAMRLCDDAIVASSALSAGSSERAKSWVSIDGAYAEGCFPLGGIVLLEYADETKHVLVRGKDLIGELSLHSRGVPPLDDERILIQQFTQLVSLINGGYVSRLSRPRDLSDIEGSVESFLDSVLAATKAA